MVNLPFIPLGHRCFDSPEPEVLQLSVSSEVPTHLNSDGHEKLRQDEWLISTIMREINHLARINEAERKTPKKLPLRHTFTVPITAHLPDAASFRLVYTFLDFP
jgi:hypothetical protein